MAETGDLEGSQSGGLLMRALLALIGGLAGAAWWFVGARLPALVAGDQPYLLIVSGLAAFFGAFFALIGPLPLVRALPAAVVAALIPANLLTWASLRHDSLPEFFARIDPAVAGFVAAALPLPFVIAALTPGAGWRHYPTLFAASWGIAVRFAAAALFALVFWLAVFLANELLRIAGIEVIGDLIAIDWLPPVATGMVAGLALASVNELDDLLSYSLVLRLMRLLLPPALLVVGAFVAALPFQGYDRLFGILSPAGTFLVICLVLILLINAAIGAEDEDAVRTGFMRLATRATALLLPVLAALSVEAVRVRILAHGLSPGRLALGLAALVLLGYGLVYAVSALTGRRWMARIRRGNVWMAVVVIALAVLWLTPVLNPERIAASSQVARYEEGALDAETVDLWSLRHDWGRAGEAALAALAADASPDLARRLSLLDVAPDRATFDNPVVTPGAGSSRTELKEVMPVMPPEAVAEFDRFVLPWYAGSVTGFLEGCRDRTATGRPGCALVVADLLPDNPGNEGILFYKSFGLLRGEVIVPEPIYRRADASEVFSVPPPDFAETDEILDALQEGAFTAGPARINAITIGNRQFTVPF